MPHSFDPHGSVVVVTGAGSGIGRALALRAGASGARAVVVCDIDEVGARATASLLAHETGGVEIVRTVNLDVSNEAAVAEAAEQVELEVGPIDLWCSNAGVHRGEGLGDDDAWRESWDLHVLAHVYVARHVVPRMTARGRGWLLVTASAAGLLSDFTSAPYTVTKHAAVAFAEWLSIRHGDDGVNVSCVCPQAVNTAMNSTRRGSTAGSGAKFLEPDDVAAQCYAALASGAFLVLPHPEVAAYEQRRAGDRDRWLAGMRRTSAQLKSSNN